MSGTPPAGPPAPAAGRDARPIVWGAGDVVAAWFAGLLASIVAAAFMAERRTPAELALLLCVQDGAIVLWLALVARRKGLGSLGADFGLRLAVGAKRWWGDVPWFFAGVGLQLAWVPALLLLQEVHGSVARQEAVRIASRSTGVAVPLIFLAVGLLAPVAEELLYRGALLRSLMRRTTPAWSVLISALVFAVVHFGDPSTGTLMAFPALFSLGLVTGYQAVRTGDLRRPVLLHVGFNILSVIAILTEIT